MLPTKIVVIGAGSAQFGLNSLAAILRHPKLKGSTLALVDRNAESLDLVHRLANQLNETWASGMQISAHSHHVEALKAGADFVILSIEVSPREGLWRSDFEIPLKYGVRQPYGENGGPGGFAHAARNIGPVLEIAHDMEKYCPDAWVINYTNPMIRICDAIARHSRIKVVGLCHQIKVGYAMAGQALAAYLKIPTGAGLIPTDASLDTIAVRRELAAKAMEKIEILAAGTNHFTWMLDIRKKSTGEDLYPLFRRRWQAQPESYEPLTRRMYETMGLFPMPGDAHLAEYLPWVSDPSTKPWQKYGLALYEWDRWAALRGRGYRQIERMLANEEPITSLEQADSEGAVEIILSIAGANAQAHLAVNLPNNGCITNLPEDAVVEIPAVSGGAGVRGAHIGALPESIAELCRREITVSRLCVDSAATGDREKALQCLLLDPVITDIEAARLILTDYLETYREFLPQYWDN